MISMWMDLKRYIKIFSVLISLGFSGCALLERMTEPAVEPVQVAPRSDVFLRGEALMRAREFEKAKPFLLSTLNLRDSDHDTALLLLARAYDQTGEAEKSILALQELLTKNLDKSSELRARTLLLKNLYKVHAKGLLAEQKKMIETLGATTSQQREQSLSDMAWAMDLNCDQYCLSEIDFFKDFQIHYVYLIEKEPALADRASDTLRARYFFFEEFLSKDRLAIDLRKKIAVALLDAMKRLKDLELDRMDAASIRLAKTIRSLDEAEQRIESWLYK